MNESQLLESCAKHLFGQRYITGLAELLELSRPTVYRYMNPEERRKTPIPVSVWSKVRGAMAEKNIAGVLLAKRVRAVQHPRRARRPRRVA